MCAHYRSTFAIGSTAVTCNATDSSGNAAIPTHFNVIVQDTIAPVIAPHGDVVVEATSGAGAIVTYVAPNSTDAVDGTLPAICSPDSGILQPIGSTVVTCTKTDSHGNVATPTTFNLIVRDTVGPVISYHEDITVEATSSYGSVVTYVSPDANDVVDGTFKATCTPASGEVFPIGETTVTCNAIDSRGNHATSTTFKVTVVDTTAPVIDIHTNITTNATSVSGAVVTYTNPSATDLVDGAIATVCAPVSGSTFAIGVTTVTCTATDSHKNSASTTFTVTVVDTAPVIAPHANITVDATSASGAIVNYTAPAVTDAVDGSISAACTPASGTQFAVGTTTVTCTAVDSANNTVTSTFTVTVNPYVAPAVTTTTTTPTTQAPAVLGATNAAPQATTQAPVATENKEVKGAEKKDEVKGSAEKACPWWWIVAAIVAVVLAVLGGVIKGQKEDGTLRKYYYAWPALVAAAGWFAHNILHDGFKAVWFCNNYWLVMLLEAALAIIVYKYLINKSEKNA